MTNTVSVGAILGRTLLLLRRNAARAMAALAAMAGLGAFIDSGAAGSADGAGLNFLASALTTVAGYWLSKALLQDLAGRPLPARFPAYFGLGLLSGVGILLGSVLLVVPGIVLFVRWSISTPILLSGDEGVVEAMQLSWHRTGPNFWRILLALLAIYGPAAALGIGAYALFDSGWGTATVILANLALDAGLIAGWHAAVAIHGLIGESDGLAETFA